MVVASCGGCVGEGWGGLHRRTFGAVLWWREGEGCWLWGGNIKIWWWYDRFTRQVRSLGFDSPLKQQANIIQLKLGIFIGSIV